MSWLWQRIVVLVGVGFNEATIQLLNQFQQPPRVWFIHYLGYQAILFGGKGHCILHIFYQRYQ